MIVMLESHQALSLVPGDIIDLDTLINAESNYEAYSLRVGIAVGRVDVAPFEVSDGTIMILKTHYVLFEFWRPDEHLSIVCCRTSQ